MLVLIVAGDHNAIRNTGRRLLTTTKIFLPPACDIVGDLHQSDRD
jgi:hypothetical protein